MNTSLIETFASSADELCTVCVELKNSNKMPTALQEETNGVLQVVF